MTTIIVNDKSDSENLRFDWKLEEDGTLIVEGAGKMPDLGAGNHAQSLWQDIRDEITKVQIGEGIIEIREAPAGVTEEWFWSANTSGFGGGIETNLLEQWLKDHPEISVLSKDESREKQKYRWFVSI